MRGRSRLWVVARTELRQLRQSPDFWLPMLILAGLFFVVIPTFLLFAITHVHNDAVVAKVATTLDVLRPLVGMDKDEISAEADRIGTLPISNIPDQDCCQLFTPRHPATRARTQDVEAAEAALPIDAMVDAAVAAATTEDFRFPVLLKYSAGSASA